MKKEPGIIFVSLLLLFFILDVQSPVLFYGTQIFGLLFLVVYRFIVYPKISKGALGLFFFSIIFLELICFYQYQYIGESILFLVYQRVVFLICVAVLLYDYLIKVRRLVLIQSIKYFIFLLSGIVITQFVGFYFLNLDRGFLDFGLILGGEESRTWYLGDWVYRPVGLSSEPSMFVGVQFGLLTLQYILDKKAFFSRILGVVSLTLSMSFLGLILAALFLLICYSKGIKNYVLGLVFLIIFYLFSYEKINTRLNLFADGGDGSNNIKFEALSFFVSDPNITLFGYGFLLPSSGSPEFYDALLDLTFYINTITIFGFLFGTLILFFFAFYIINLRLGLRGKLLVLLSLVKLSNPSFLFFSCFVLFFFTIIRIKGGLKE
jgi:hypothetical protein